MVVMRPNTLLVLSVFCLFPMDVLSAQPPSGQSLSEVISADFRDSERLASSNIEAHVENGLVTLSGFADSLMDKQLADTIAKRTVGVRAVANQVIVKPSERTDEEIQDDVVKVLRANGAVDRPQAEVEVAGGVVALMGKVDSLAEKRIAKWAASGVRGVRDVDNQLTVALTLDRPDETLREEINTLLVHSVYLDDVNLSVEVDDGVAVLSGKVRVAEQKEAAGAIASVSGIVEVDLSGVAVDENVGDPSVRKQRYADVNDQVIMDVLEKSFRNDPLVFDVASSIDVSIDDGTVTLTGQANRLIEKTKAESLARGVVGVNRVVNELKIRRPQDPPSDIEIVEETQAALKRSSHLQRRDFRVHCQRAHVSLYGLVESQLEKQIAGWLADGVSGVVHVNNSLAVEQPWNEKSDEEIKTDLQRKLKYTFLDASNQVDVTIENGVAILRGEVDTWRQWQAAIDLALEAGARHPHNLINVRYHPPHGGSGTYVPR